MIVKIDKKDREPLAKMFQDILDKAQSEAEQYKGLGGDYPYKVGRYEAALEWVISQIKSGGIIVD